MRRDVLQKLFIGITTLLLATSCSNSSSSDGGGGVNPGGGPVTVSINPVDGSTINASSPIVISFSGSVDPVSAVRSGVLTTDNASLIWSSTTNANDTLTILPAMFWTEGLGKIFRDCKLNCVTAHYLIL